MAELQVGRLCFGSMDREGTGLAGGAAEGLLCEGSKSASWTKLDEYASTVAVHCLDLRCPPHGRCHLLAEQRDRLGRGAVAYLACRARVHLRRASLKRGGRITHMALKCAAGCFHHHRAIRLCLRRGGFQCDRLTAGSGSHRAGTLAHEGKRRVAVKHAARIQCKQLAPRVARNVVGLATRRCKHVTRTHCNGGRRRLRVERAPQGCLGFWLLLRLVVFARIEQF